MNSFATILRFKRKEMKLSQKGFAELAKIGEVQVNMYEKGKAVPREDILKKITDALHLPKGFFDRHLWRSFPTQDKLEAEIKTFIATNKSQRDWLMLFEFVQSLNEGTILSQEPVLKAATKNATSKTISNR